MTPFSDIDTKRLKRFTQQMEEFTDAIGISNPPIQWESWFAWHPVKVKGKWIWFKEVYRKYNWAKSTEQPFGKEYDYGTIFDVLADDQHN